MKKICSLFICFVLIFSFCFSAFAEEADYDYLMNGEGTIKLILPAEEDRSAVIKFVPEKDGTLAFASSSENADPYCILLGGAFGEILANSDDYLDFDFYLVYEFEAGEDYYFLVGNYSEEAEEIELTLGCAHKFVDGVCTVCEYVCDHSVTDSYFHTCLCGESYDGSEINAGETVSFSPSYVDEGETIFRFIPEKSGVYSLRSDCGEFDPCVTLYDAYGQMLNYADDGEDYNFVLYYQFEVGEKYYFAVSDYNENATIKITLAEEMHNAENGEVHEIEYRPFIEPDCINVGYNEGLYCPVCDEIIFGCEEIAPVLYHFDADGDDVCDVCGAEIEYFADCPHICHSANWFISTLWRIINFFNSIFGINEYCFCGEAHHHGIAVPYVG